MKINMIAAIAALSLVIPTIGSAQGFAIQQTTSLTSNQFGIYLSSAGVVGEVNSGGQVGFPPSYLQAYDGPAALSTAVSFTNGGGIAGISILILNGVELSTGTTAGYSASQPDLISGLVIGLYNPSQTVGSASSLSGLNINGIIPSDMPATVSSPFSAYYYSFQDPTSTLNVNAEFDTTMGSGSQLYFIPVVEAVPEPSSLALLLVGSIGLLTMVQFYLRRA